MNKKCMRIIALSCLIIILLSCSSALQLSKTVQDQSVDILRYEVDEAFVGILKHNIQIINPTFSTVTGELLVPLIRNETGRNYVILCNISSSAGKPVILYDNSENMYASWDNIIIHGKQTFTVELSYYVFSLNIRYLIDPSLIGEYDKNSDLYEKYTQPEKLIQSTHPDIVAVAQNITSDMNNTHEKVSKIYNFVITHLRYATQEEEKGALWALKNGVGDCSEYSYLFVALCRAAGIPARIQAGFAFHYDNEALNNGHMWAEYYIENYGWVPVDATWRLFDTMDYRHFSSIQSIPELTPYTNYILNSTKVFTLENEQNIKLEKSSPNIFGEASSFIESADIAIEKINQAKFTLFIAKIFGATLIFSSEATNTEQTLLKSKISLQNAIDLWRTFPQIAETKVAEALKNAAETSQSAWMLIAETFILLISILVTIMIGALVFMKRRYRQLLSSSSLKWQHKPYSNTFINLI